MKKPTPNYDQNLSNKAVAVTVHCTVDMVSPEKFQSGQLWFLDHNLSYKTPNGVIQKRNSTRQNKEQLSCLSFSQIPTATVTNRIVKIGYEN